MLLEPDLCHAFTFIIAIVPSQIFINPMNTNVIAIHKKLWISNKTTKYIPLWPDSEAYILLFD